MGGLKSAFKSIKRFVKKNTRDIATVIGFAIGGPAGAAIGQGIGSLGEGRDLGDTTTLADPSVVDSLVENRKNT